ncbi:NUDIX domain-containing protein [Actinoplanes sp. GCM10030250]|uniref:NUDIX domain-containing protein n=1 Tax=Actinoplanes sp. GCM10030250 TaxID=3273376 RepID=UPI00360C7218
MTKPMLILIAGPYRSGTGDNPALMAANLARLEEAAWPIFQAGHIPMIGEWVALPVLRGAGPDHADEVFYPAAERLLAHCDAVLRLPGGSKGADQDVAIARSRGLPVYVDVAEIPASQARPAPQERPGIERPDARGRTGLDQQGRDLAGNPDVVIRDVELLATAWHVLRRTTYDYRRRDGSWSRQQRETYDRGDGATVLLYDPTRGTVLLTRQFRFPVYVNGHPDGMFVEAAAGLLDGDDPAAAIRREAAEELGVEVGALEPVFNVWMSPGSVTERLHCFAAPYSVESRTGAGGGLADDGEDIEAVELPFEEALKRTTTGEIADAKTIMLLQWAALHGPFRLDSAGSAPLDVTGR